MIRGARPLLSSSLGAVGARQTSSRLALGSRATVIATTRFATKTTPFRPVGVLPLVAARHALAFRIQYSTKTPDPLKKHEQELANQKLEKNPEGVSSDSSVRKVIEPTPGAKKTADEDVLRGVKTDFNTIKDTFSLTSVPRESYALGLAGTLPYLGTSLSTLYLAWNIRTPWPTSSNLQNSFMLSHESAQQLLALLEPIQVGYGAVIISFLGAIHWGLEYAEKTPLRERTRFRYGIGVLAPMVAWPTVMMPLQYALIVQFAAFTGLYFADTRAATRGWAPEWYGTYRFVLTFVVGAAIVISLLGRSRIEDAAHSPSHVPRTVDEELHHGGPAPLPEDKWRKLEEEEKARIQAEKEEEEKKKKEEEAEAKKNKGKGSKSKGDDDKAKGAASQHGDKDGAKDGAKDKAKDEDQKDDGETKSKDDAKPDEKKKDNAKPDEKKKDNGKPEEKKKDDGKSEEKKKDDGKSEEEKKDEEGDKDKSSGEEKSKVKGKKE